VECKKCHHRFRADQLESKKCPDCKGELMEAKQFNLMLKTFLGPVEDKDSIVYFRPETAQAMFVDFKNVLETSRKKIPFGIAQIGKAFRNEITPGNFIFRTREFEQMEIEYFIEEKKWQEVFEHWRNEMQRWMTDVLGLNKEHIHELDVAKEELAHYSKKTIDFEYEFPFGKKELYGLAYRTDFDLKNHFKDGAPYKEEGVEPFYPHVIEPTFGVDRSVLAILCDAYKEEEERIVLKLKPSIAPYKVAVFPLLKNKPELVEKAKAIYDELRKDFMVAWDDRGNIGKRYYSQDEIGTPYCITVDFDTLEKGEVTVRDRDTMKQEKVNIKDLKQYINERIS
jgi:glycyl-tRNA synthetase